MVDTLASNCRCVSKLQVKKQSKWQPSATYITESTGCAHCSDWLTKRREIFQVISALTRSQNEIAQKTASVKNWQDNTVPGSCFKLSCFFRCLECIWNPHSCSFEIWMRLTRKLNRIDSEVRNASLNSNFWDKSSSGPLNIGTFEERAVMIHHKA